MQFPDTPNTLDADTAEELLRFFDKYPVLKIAGFSLWTFDEMTPDAARVIADSGLDILFLDSVRVVSPEVIRILVESPVSFLSLGGLVEISPEVAELRSGFRGSCLKLGGVTGLSPAVAMVLSRFPNLLSLGGIKTLGTAAAKALAQHHGELMAGWSCVLARRRGKGNRPARRHAAHVREPAVSIRWCGKGVGGVSGEVGDSDCGNGSKGRLSEYMVSKLG